MDTKATETFRNALRGTSYREAGDSELVIAALLADCDAFEELIRRYRGAVTVTAQGVLGNWAVAEEVAQDVFVIAFQTLPSLDEPVNFGAWVRAIARFRALRVRDREKRTEATESEPLEALMNASHAPACGDSPEATLDRAATRTVVWDALDRLTVEHREALYLHYCEEWPLERIARFLCVPMTTVKGRLFRARDAFRRTVCDEEIFSGMMKG